MLKVILRHTYFSLTCLMIMLLLDSCFAIDKSLFKGIIMAKNLWVQVFSILAIVFITIRVFFTKNIHIKIVDILVFTFCLWMIGRELFSLMPYANPQKYILYILLYFCIYLFFRSIENSAQVAKAIITIYLIVICTQAIIGLLQLYGFLHSHHALFKITGTFHNPGPFSGYVVSGLPMALGLYLGTRKSSQSAVGSRQSVFGDQYSVPQKIYFGGYGILLRSIFSKQFWVDLRLGKVLSSEFWVWMNWDKVLNYFAQFVIVVLLLVLPAARSRAAWLGGIVGLIYVFYKVQSLEFKKVLGLGFGVNTKLKRLESQPKTQNTEHVNQLGIQNSRLIKSGLIILIIFAIVLGCYGIYKFKQGSADGRLLMWQVSWEMIKDKPITGWGQGGFDANYANYQAEWFKSGKGTKAQEMVAGSPEAPFNELIRVTVNYGLVGLFLVLMVLCFVFRVDLQHPKVLGSEFKTKHKPQAPNPEQISNVKQTQNSKQKNLTALLKGGLISILIFSLFSYPLDVIPISVQLILLFALIINQNPEQLGLVNKLRTYIPEPISAVNQLKTQNLLLKFASLLLISIIPLTVLNIKDSILGLKHWQEANKMYKYELYSDASDEFELALQYLPKEGLLLQMHAKCHSMLEKWEEAINTATQSQNYDSGQILNIVLGDAYKAQGNYKQSEKAYKYASSMIPHKFFPKYLLAKMYDECGQKDKAVKLAYKLINKKIKIESTAIQEMRSELMNIINAREKEQEAALSQNLALPVPPPFQRKKGGS